MQKKEKKNTNWVGASPMAKPNSSPVKAFNGNMVNMTDKIEPWKKGKGNGSRLEK